VDPLTLYGTPKVLDAFLRPPARFVHLSVGGFASVLLFWLGYPLVAPLPFALGFVWYEWFFWSRGDRPFQLRLDPAGRVEVYEPLSGRRWETPLDEITSATVVYRSTGDGRHDCVAVLASTAEVRLAIQFRISDFTPRPEDVNAELWDAVFGGVSGLIRTLAPKERLVRQTIADGRGLVWLREALPAEVWRTTSARVWRGCTPRLDLFGYHDEAPTGLLTLGEETVSLVTEAASHQHPLGTLVMARSERTITLFRMWGEESEEADEEVPLLLVDVGPLTVAIPTPSAGQAGEFRPLSDDLLHMHAPEGAALVWHLLRDLDRDSWPDALDEWVTAGEAFVEATA